MPTYGGQALIEGVLMRGNRNAAAAFRAPDGQITSPSAMLGGLLGRLNASAALWLPFGESEQRMCVLSILAYRPRGQCIVRSTSTSMPSRRIVAASSSSLSRWASHQPRQAARSCAVVASAVEFVLEGLHLAKRLNKDASGARAVYRARSASV